MKNGPSVLLMDWARTEFIDPKTQPEQLSFWPEEVTEFKLCAPGPDYPWRFHERMQHYKAMCMHPAIAAVLAEEDVEREKAAQEKLERELRPPLFEAA